MKTDKKQQGSKPLGTTPEAVENRMVTLAIAQAERQLKNGTASSQIITHYLKLASPNAKLEREILENQSQLIAAKTKAINAAEKNEELYKEAMAAMRMYSGADTSSNDY